MAHSKIKSCDSRIMKLSDCSKKSYTAVAYFFFIYAQMIILIKTSGGKSND